MTEKLLEGWTWLMNSKKWHYFRESKSLCGKFMLLGSGEFEQGNDDSPSNCSACRKKLDRERQNRAALLAVMDVK